MILNIVPQIILLVVAKQGSDGCKLPLNTTEEELEGSDCEPRRC